MKSKLCVLGFLLVPIMALAVLDNEIDWRYGRQGVGVVTNAPSRAMHTALSNRVGVVETAVTNHASRILFLEGNTVRSVNGQTGAVSITAEGLGAATPGDLAGYLPLEGGTMGAGASITIPGHTPGAHATHIENGLVQVSAMGVEARLTPGAISLKDPVGTTADIFATEIQTPTGRYQYPDTPGGGTIATKEDLRDGVSGSLDSATNAIHAAVAAILATSNGWLTVSNSILTVHALTNPAAPAAVIWSSAEAGAQDTIPPAATNQLWQAIGAINSALGAKADKAWGKYSPDGSANPDPAYMTFLNAPVTMFGSGAAWATAGAYAVFTTPGAAAFAASDKGGELRIGPDVSTNYFGFRMGGSYLVGARTDGIKVHNAGTTNGYAELTYDSFGDGKPHTIWMTTDFGIEWATVDPVWVDDGNSAVATVPATTAKCFFMATTEAHFDSIFFSRMPAAFEGGVIGSTNAAPVVYDSTITITSGGRTYRIPAQEVP